MIIDLAEKILHKHRVQMQERHTAGLEPGWYVCTGFFWHDHCDVVAGPFSSQDDASLARTALKERTPESRYYVDEVEPPR